ncbi:MAG: hypothetical protein U5J83_12775 [Bryobacterales bacterium]|nr:hypothetical protein [Bryobacterales bacterium]
MPRKNAATKAAPGRKRMAATTKRVKKEQAWVGPGVRVRMYRPGLGDCFLLSFGDGAAVKHVLIDCGVFVGTSDEKATMQRIASDVVATVGDGPPDQSGAMAAVVATHEHWDHVAGFYYADEILRKLEPERVWVAWTEDPLQTIAQEAKARHRQMASAAHVAAERLASSPVVYDRECGSAVAELLGFGGAEPGPALGARFSRRSDTGMSFATAGFGTAPSYLEPGKVMDFDWVPGGLRVYVLGPPMDREALVQGRTAEEEGFKKAVGDGSHGAWMAGVLGAANTGNPEELEFFDRHRPFDAARALPEEDVFREVQRKEFPRQELLSAKTDAATWSAKLALLRDYASEDWRRIDGDWLHSAASLALQLDRSINNTSLVLAFELVESGKVMLFVGDAELENWKSWQGLKFDVKDESGGSRTVTAGELLERTVFYKVGHHGSGNATLRTALDRMKSPELVAAVPTDEIFAQDRKRWEMPAALLRPELHRKTRGRVLYATPSIAAIEQPEVGVLPEEAWKRFAEAVSGGQPGDLFVDYRIDLGP